MSVICFAQQSFLLRTVLLLEFFSCLTFFFLAKFGWGSVPSCSPVCIISSKIGHFSLSTPGHVFHFYFVADSVLCSNLNYYEKLVMWKSRRQPQSSVTVCRFRKQKSCCSVITIPQAGIAAPTLTVMQDF